MCKYVIVVRHDKNIAIYPAINVHSNDLSSYDFWIGITLKTVKKI